ncbi:MAG: hypothetical protein VKJ24_05120 [Synechococcales bacterium]|nr:hypothetical protein [Synechococcales bacterium]
MARGIVVRSRHPLSLFKYTEDPSYQGITLLGTHPPIATWATVENK